MFQNLNQWKWKMKILSKFWKVDLEIKITRRNVEKLRNLIRISHRRGPEVNEQIITSYKALVSFKRMRIFRNSNDDGCRKGLVQANERHNFIEERVIPSHHKFCWRLEVSHGIGGKIWRVWQRRMLTQWRYYYVGSFWVFIEFAVAEELFNLINYPRDLENINSLLSKCCCYAEKKKVSLLQLYLSPSQSLLHPQKYRRVQV